MEVKYIGVVGSREIKDKEFVFKTLDYYLQNLIKENEIIICSGGAFGIDRLSVEWACLRGLKTIEYLPDYENNPPKIAPLIRNTQIVEQSDYLLAITTGSRGTADSIRKAEEKGIPIKIVKI